MRPALALASVALVLALAACGDWPDLGIDGAAAGEARLVPFDAVVAPGALYGDEATEAAEADAALLARAEALRARAAATGLSAEDRARLDALRDRPRPDGE